VISVRIAQRIHPPPNLDKVLIQQQTGGALGADPNVREVARPMVLFHALAIFVAFLGVSFVVVVACAAVFRSSRRPRTSQRGSIRRSRSRRTSR
jgi:hypothetical protein